MYRARNQSMQAKQQQQQQQSSWWLPSAVARWFVGDFDAGLRSEFAFMATATQRKQPSPPEATVSAASPSAAAAAPTAAEFERLYQQLAADSDRLAAAMAAEERDELERRAPPRL